MSARLRGCAAIAAVLAASLERPAAAARAQTVAAAPAQFEVASVRRNVSGDAEGSIGPQPNGRFVVSNVPLRFILQVSYELPAFRVVGGPDWIDVERYDIQGKAAGVATNAELSAMMRTLLGERFKLKTHTDTRPVAGFAMVRAREDGRLGPQLGPHAEPCPPPPAPAEPERGGLPLCGMMSGSDRVIRMSARPMTDLATLLSRRLARPVVDRTGLTGLFDVRLEWTDDARSSAPLTAAGDGVSVYTALQEQLGLKLQGERVATEFMVIDTIEHPTDD